jgi:hypothetical protein
VIQPSTQNLETACSSFNYSESEQQESQSNAPEIEDEDRFFNLHHSSASADDNDQCLAYVRDRDAITDVLKSLSKNQ